MEALWHDIRFEVRMLAKRPGFALAAVLTLALGIGATTAIFTVVNGVLLRPLPYPEPERIVQLWQVGDKDQQLQFAEPNFTDLREQSSSFEALAHYASSVVSVAGGSEPARTGVAVVSEDFFRVLGVQPVRGRSFSLEENRPGGPPAVLVSYGFWRRYLGADPDFSKHKLRSFNQVFPVIGVMPPGFEFPAGADAWVPRALWPPNPSRTAHNWRVIGRLAKGVSVRTAQQEASVIAQRLKQQYGVDTWMENVALVPLHEQTVGGLRTALLVLLGAAGFLLLVACANVVNLLLARAAARQRELAVRTALGASRWRLVRQFLTESLLLALAGGVLGLLVAGWGVRVLVAFEPGNLPRTEEVFVDWRVIVFAIAVSAATAVTLGWIAATRVTGRRLHESLKEGGRTGIGGGQRLRSCVVVSQLALTLVLLVGAGLMARSFLRLLEQDPGFRIEGLVTMSLASPPPADAAGRERLAQFHEALMARLGSLPGVEQVGGINAFPMSGGYANGLFLIMQGDEEIGTENFARWAQNPERSGYAEFRIASAGYFRAMGIPLLRGRLFEERDGPNAPHVAVISESLAQQQFPDHDPLGQRIQFGNMDGDMRLFTIVGIVGDIRERGLDAQPRAMFYGNYRQRPGAASNFTVVMSGQVAAGSLVVSARSILREMAPEVPPRFRTIEDIVSRSLAGRRFGLLLLGVFGGAALLLAVLGIYGVTAYAAEGRTQEIGIRMALGAQKGDVLRLILRQGSRLVVMGAALGIAGAMVLTRYLRTLLFEVSPTDPATLVAITVLLGAVAILATLIPARRATRVDPMVALRYE